MQCGILAYKEPNGRKFQFLEKPFSYSKDFSVNPFDVIKEMKLHYEEDKRIKNQNIRSIIPLQYLTQRMNIILYINYIYYIS